MGMGMGMGGLIGVVFFWVFLGGVGGKRQRGYAVCFLTFCEYGGFAGFEGGVGDGEDELVAWFGGWG